MDRLLELRDIPADYADRMAAILVDRSNDELLRNFAAQHLGLYVGRLSALGRYDQDSAPARKVRASLSLFAPPH